MPCPDTRIDYNSISITNYDKAVERLHEATRAACCMLGYVEKLYGEDALDIVLNDAYPELKKWWKEHKEAESKLPEDTLERWFRIRVEYVYSNAEHKTIWQHYAVVFADSQKKAFKKAKKSVKRFEQEPITFINLKEAGKN